MNATLGILDRLADEYLVGKMKRTLYPKRIATPTGYMNPKYHAVAEFSVVTTESGRDIVDDQMKQAIWTTVTLGAKYQWPTYFVAPEFLAGVAVTEPPRDMTLEGVVWPLPSMRFCLPLNFMSQYIDKWVFPFVTITHVTTGVTETPFCTFDSGDEMFVCEFPLLLPNGLFTHYASWTSINKPIQGMIDAKIDEASASFAQWAADRAMIDSIPELRCEIPTLEEEEIIGKRMTGLAVKLLLALNEVGESYIETGEHRPARMKHGRVWKEELWNPNFIGRKYRLYRENGNGDGTHASPRWHWRRGHWRHQRFGPQLGQRKLIRIHPVLVNAPREEES